MIYSLYSIGFAISSLQKIHCLGILNYNLHIIIFLLFIVNT